MKIVSQLRIPEANAAAKSTTPSDGGAAFRDVLTTAKADRSVTGPPDHKADKAEATDGKKKAAVLKAPVSEVAADPTQTIVSSNPQQTIVIVNIGASEAVPCSQPEGDSQSTPAIAVTLPSEPTKASAEARDTTASVNTVVDEMVGVPVGKTANNAEVVTRDGGQQTSSGFKVPQADPSAEAQPVPASLRSNFTPVGPSAQATDNSKTADSTGLETTTSPTTAADNMVPPTQAVATTSNQSASLLAALPSFLPAGDKQPTSPDVSQKNTAPATNSQIDSLTTGVTSSPTNAPAPPLTALREAIGTIPTTQMASPTVTSTVATSDVVVGAKDVASRQVQSATKNKAKIVSPNDGDEVADDKTSSADRRSVTEESPSFVKAIEAASPTQDMSVVSNAVAAGSGQQTASVGLTDRPAHALETQTASSPLSTTNPSSSLQTVPDAQAMQGVTSAQLTQSIRSSEMKLGMQSAEFGNISITTSLNHQAISAQISLDHSELGRALAVHLPAIEEKLGSAYGVQARVELRESYNPSSTNDSGYGTSRQQNKEQHQSEEGRSTANVGATFVRTANLAAFAATYKVTSNSRLDIRI